MVEILECECPAPIGMTHGKHGACIELRLHAASPKPVPTDRMVLQSIGISPPASSEDQDVPNLTFTTIPRVLVV